MAHRMSGYLMRSMMQQRNSHRSFSSSSSSPTPQSKWALKADMAPLYLLVGFTVLAASIASHTAYQQLRYNPNVYFSKKKRATIEEAENPMNAVNHGGKFVDKSFLRKVAHIQEKGQETIPNPVNGNIYTRSRHAETLESIK